MSNNNNEKNKQSFNEKYRKFLKTEIFFFMSSFMYYFYSSVALGIACIIFFFVFLSM